MNPLLQAVDRFVGRVVKDERMECAWLSALSLMEERAAQQILRYLSPATPAKFVEEIKVHADDEMRHSRELIRMRPIPVLEEPRFQELEAKMRALGNSFVGSYFNNAVLATSKSKHVGYVHAALTIEQFPFQLYNSYLKSTRIPAVAQLLPGVLADEAGHLALGKKMRDELPEQERISLADLNEIEKDLCQKLMERLYRVVLDFEGVREKPEGAEFVQRIFSRDEIRCSWVRALASHELQSKDASERSRGALLQRSVEFLKKKLPATVALSALESGFVAALGDYYAGDGAASSSALREQMMRHFDSLIEEGDDLGTSYAADQIRKHESKKNDAGSAEIGVPATQAARLRFDSLRERVDGLIALYQNDSIEAARTLAEETPA